MIRALALVLVTFSCLTAPAADPPFAADLTHLEARWKILAEQVRRLEAGNADPKAVADVAVCAKAAEWILRHDEFHKPDYAEKTAKVLGLGEARAKAVAGGEAEWGRGPGGVAVGYVSAVDGSVQPYALTL